MGRSKAIIPKKLVADPQRMARVLTNTMNSTALAMKTDFGVTVQTWNNKPSFTILAPSFWVRTIGTDDPTYAMLNDGTKPHTIRPKRSKVLVFNTPFRSKTVPKSISSRSGGRGGNQVITRKPVRHPGTTAREWDTTIAQKWDRLVAGVFQRAIDSEIN